MNCKGLGAALLKNVLDSRSSEREKREMEPTIVKEQTLSLRM